MGFIINIIYRLPGIVVGFTLHEWAHAYTAVRFGDDTPRLQGRLSFDPRVHIDPIGLIMIILMGFGWAKPVEINPSRFRNAKRDRIIVSLAGSLMNITIAFICFGVYFTILYANPSFSATVFSSAIIWIIEGIISVNMMLAIFNLLPIPPLDGYNVMKTLFIRDPRPWWNIERYGFLILIALSMLGFLSRVLSFAMQYIYQAFFFVFSSLFSIF